MTAWRLVDSGLCSASLNMAMDEAIAMAVRAGDSPPTLRFYDWETPSVSLGSFQDIEDVDLSYCSAHHIPVVRRPTGGRGILHGEGLTYSFSSRNEGFFSRGLLDSYRQLSLAFMSAFQILGLEITMKAERESGRNLTRNPLCFTSSSYGEIQFQHKKLIGSAQKRWHDGLLQQGSIPYTIDNETMKRIFNLPPLPGDRNGMIGLREIVHYLSHEEFKEAVRFSFEKVFRISLIPSPLCQGETLHARDLEARKYRSPEWNSQRQAG
jgi:lipoate-protein ligase A